MNKFISGLTLLYKVNNEFDLYTKDKGCIIICGITPDQLTFSQVEKLKSCGFGIDSSNIYYYC